MKPGAHARRLTYLAHRWTGVTGCLLMALWFASGMVMLFVGYPKLTPWERLGALPALDTGRCCVPLNELPKEVSRHAGQLVLTSIGGEPRYVTRDGQGKLRALSASTGALQGPVTPESALAAARAFAPETPLRHAGEIAEDRWTHSRSLDAHRPLHRVQAQGPSPATLYISSATGAVVLDAPLSQQRWNYVGAWLHWLYMFRDRSVDPVWSWIVIVLSAAGTVTAVTGAIVGLWRWRFRGTYKSGARTPYREPWMRWHHIAGLLFGAFVCTWIFSGLMSMNPAGVFSPAPGTPDLGAYRGAAAPPAGALAQPARIVQALRDEGFQPVELQWRQMDGQAYVIAYDARADSRLIRGEDGRLEIAANWTPDVILPATRRLSAHPLSAHRILSEHDAYYYPRHPEAMNGGLPRGLPALQLDFADPGRTRVYIDLRTGDVAASLSRSQRAGRWLFYFLHSWDTPALLRGGLARELAVIALSLGGLVVCIAGIVIGWRRLRGSMATKSPPPATN